MHIFHSSRSFIVLTESTINEKVAPLNSTSVNKPIVNDTKVPSVTSTSSPPIVKLSTIAATAVRTTTSAPEFLIPEIKLNNTSSGENDAKFEWTDVSIDDVETNKTLIRNNITKIDEDTHEYYNSSIVQNENFTNLHRESIYASCANLTINPLLSQSHRRAMTVKLPFDFPFYGHQISNITIATGGFLYAGDYIHSWLAATQYISPLMANFDTSLSNTSFVKFCEDSKSSLNSSCDD